MERLLILKNKDDYERGDEFATLIWKEKGIEYQLLYRNVEENDEKGNQAEFIIHCE